jgi:homoserine kinase
MNIAVQVSGTTANLGPGFDCLGAALTLYNQFSFAPAEDFRCTVESTWSTQDATQVSTGCDNLAYRAFGLLFEHLGKPTPPVELTITMGVPLGRGLGSSATAIVGGLAAANAWLGEPLSIREWLRLAVALEGHPDNVVPAALGGCQLALMGTDGLLTCPLTWHSDIALILAVPSFTLSTSKARAVLPDGVPRSDAIYNLARTALLTQALANSRGDWLREALQDRLHQPYRWSLIPQAQSVRTAALEAGAWGVVISGAGPTLLALAPTEACSCVAEAIAEVWQEAKVLHPQIDPQGCRCDVSPG